MSPKSSRSVELEERAVIEAGFQLARSLGIDKLLVLTDELRGPKIVAELRHDRRVIWLARDTANHARVDDDSGDVFIELPDVRLARMNQVMFGLLVALLQGALGAGERIVCITGTASSGRLDTVLVTSPRREFRWLREQELASVREHLETRVFARVLEIALRFAVEGREGKPIGTIFLIADPAGVDSRVRQLILNPLRGHPARVRSIFHPEMVETLRELAALDGAIGIDRNGLVNSAGTYLDVGGAKARSPRGLGARHAAAMGITRNTGAIALALSESSGTVSVFCRGKNILEFERSSARAAPTRGR